MVTKADVYKPVRVNHKAGGRGNGVKRSRGFLVALDPKRGGLVAPHKHRSNHGAEWFPAEYLAVDLTLVHRLEQTRSTR